MEYAKPTTSSLARQQWLEAATKELRRLFANLGHTVPDNVRVSIGWPKGSRGETIGQCFYSPAVSDNHYEIFISPSIGDGARIIDILAHELCHVLAGPLAKHGSKFKKIALEIGLTGKMTATVAGEPMKEFAAKVIGKIGTYPAGRISENGRSVFKQTTRLIKCQCETCGYTARVTRKWLDDVGTPICGHPSHGHMLSDYEPEEE